MQERRNQVVTSNASARNVSKKNTAAAKKSNGVAKRANKAVSKKTVSNLHAVRAPRIVNVKKKDKAPFPWSVVVVAAIMTSLFLFMMMNYAEVDKYRSEIADLDSKIATMEKTQDELEVTLSNKYDLKDIGDYASDELGMVPGDQLRHHVITIDQEDKTEMHTYDDGEEGGFGFLLTGLGEVISDFIE
ncbi:MAG: hypothetical protein IJB49_08135 [Clostridia bacterium]|nr:hypothetical protein [Clostridia bacterium]